MLYFESAEVPDRWRLVVLAHLRQHIVDENNICWTFFSEEATRKAEEGILLARNEARCVPEVFELCGVCASARTRKEDQTTAKEYPGWWSFECVGMDFKQMDVSHSGNRYALVLQDYLTKWPDTQLLTEQHQQEQSV